MTSSELKADTVDKEAVVLNYEQTGEHSRASAASRRDRQDQGHGRPPGIDPRRDPVMVPTPAERRRVSAGVRPKMR
jgi:hypothetical protein